MTIYLGWWVLPAAVSAVCVLWLRAGSTFRRTLFSRGESIFSRDEAVVVGVFASLPAWVIYLAARLWLGVGP